MSIATAIQNAQQKVAAAYTAVSSKGGTLPQTQDLNNLPTAINSISGGSFIGIPREVTESGVYSLPQTDYVFTLPANVEALGNYAFYYGFYYQSHLTEAVFDCNEIHAQAFQNAFNYCTNLVTFRCTATVAMGYSCFATAFKYCSSFKNFLMPNLKKVGNGFTQAFEGVTSIEQFELPSLEEITGGYTFSNAFSGCTHLTTVSFPKLKQIKSSSSSDSNQFINCFNGCTSLVNVNFNSLEEMPQQKIFSTTFKGCTSLATLSFPALKSTSFGNNYTNQFNNMLQNVTGCTVHFPSNLQSVIGSWADVTAGFGGTNTTVLFDLTATE